MKPPMKWVNGADSRFLFFLTRRNLVSDQSIEDMEFLLERFVAEALHFQREVISERRHAVAVQLADK